jgi:copper ion binding protein
MIGIEETVAEVLPQDKEKHVRELKDMGRTVAMIGDGINDAPALAAADVGMAIGAGTDVAIESADIVLMKSDLRDAVTAVKLSRAVIRNIKQNLFWAFFYNAIGIPLAAGVWYPAFGVKLNPMFGAAAMSLSSIFVVGNALRLKGFKSKTKIRTGKKQTEQTKAEAVDIKTNKSKNRKSEQEREDKKMTKTITIEGMMCVHCTGRVQKALEAVEGVKNVKVSLEKKNAVVEADGEISDETLKNAVTEAGYEVKGIE